MTRSSQRQRGRPRRVVRAPPQNSSSRRTRNQAPISPSRLRARRHSPNRRSPNSEIPSPRRFSPRFNRLQSNGDRVRSSSRLRNTNSPIRRNLIDSIVDSARQPSVSRRNNNVSRYDLNYHQRSSKIVKIKSP